MGVEPSIDGTTIRLASFIGVLLIVACLEAFFPRRRSSAARFKRWPHNLGISIASQVLVRALVPITAVAFALETSVRGWGLLNVVSLNPLAEILIAILLLDLSIYWQHRVFHLINPLWRLHRMHHADLFFDVTTGIRFHPFSILISVFIKLMVLVLVGAPVVAVLIFEILLNATSLFNHSNFNVPASIDKYLRLIVVTPDMHRIHHSIDETEMNRNFGFNFPWWDRLFGTYLAMPRKGHEEMAIGLSEFRAPSEQKLWKMLTQPFRNPSDHEA